MLLNNASTVLKRIARTFDDLITEPHIRRYYEWLMLYGEDDEKGDCLIDARGSTALVERDIQNQALLQLGNFLADPEFGIDKRKWFMEMAKAQRLDPNKFTYSDDEIEARMQQMAQQPQQQDPRVVAAQASIQTAQIRAESDIEKENIQSQTDMAELEFKRETMQMDNQARREEIAMQREIKIMELAQAQNLSIAQIKAQLADTAMKERSKQKLQADEIAVKQQVGSGI
jgi:phage-related minor tail protein